MLGSDVLGGAVRPSAGASPTNASRPTFESARVTSANRCRSAEHSAQRPRCAALSASIPPCRSPVRAWTASSSLACSQFTMSPSTSAPAVTTGTTPFPKWFTPSRPGEEHHLRDGGDPVGSPRRAGTGTTRWEALGVRDAAGERAGPTGTGRQGLSAEPDPDTTVAPVDGAAGAPLDRTARVDDTAPSGDGCGAARHSLADVTSRCWCGFGSAFHGPVPGPVPGYSPITPRSSSPLRRARMA